jgi:predicted Zn-dependent protease
MTQYYGGGNRGLPWHYLIGAGIAVIGFIVYLTHTSVNPVTGEKQHVALSPQQEVQLGLQSAPQMAAEMGGEVDPSDPQAQEVTRIGQKVVQNSAAGRESPYRFQFHLLRDSQTVNAFALPGGQVFITRGLLERLQNEGELAGVLGHESGHVVGRHASEQMAKSQLMQELVAAVGVAASDRDHPGRGYSAAMIAGVVAQMKNLQYTRHDETQADEFGLRFMSEAGYDPKAMLEVMQILETVTPKTGRQPEFMVTHPYPEHRMEDIQQWLKEHFPNGVPTNLTEGAPLRNGVPAGGRAPVRGPARDKW